MRHDKQKIVTGIGQSVPQKLMNGMVKKVVNDGSDHAKSVAKELRRRGGAKNKEIAYKIDKSVDRGDFRTERKEYDHSKSKEVKKYIDQKMESAGARASKSEQRQHDNFVKKMHGNR